MLALVREAEQKTGEKCVWIIVDTLSRAMAGGDENSPVDIRRIVASADRFRSETGAHFTYVHHTGKARGARGHSLLRAATDTEIETSASSMALTKQRDGELGFQIGFTLVDIDIGRDPTGLRGIAKSTGLNIVMGCGYYISRSHPVDLEQRRARRRGSRASRRSGGRG